MSFRIEDKPEGKEVEFPALKLITKLGYEYQDLYQNRQEREKDTEVIIYKRLKKAIERLNPELDDEQVNDALNQIHERNFSSSLDPVEANERIRIKLIGLSQENALDQPVQVKSLDKNGNPIDVDVKFIEFDPEKIDDNDFLVTNQFKIHGNKDHILPDIVVFVNGIPLVVIECKQPAKSDYLQAAFDENFNNYKRKNTGWEKLFFYNHLMIATCDIAASYGTLSSGPAHFSKWTDPYPLAREDVAKLCERTPSAQDILLAGILNKKNLLNSLENFVMYQTAGNQKIKLVGKHQQLRVVSKALKRIEETSDKGGVIWHTPGSGKSYSMAFFANQLLFKKKNPAILVITDRRQLNEQITENFEKSGLAKPIQAKNSKHLSELLENPKGKTIMVNIQKFGTDNLTDVHTEALVYVLVDEAHRTQYGFTATDMRNTIPNGIFFGFTGTPIQKKKRITTKEFGDIIDTYSFEDAIRDGVTLPVKYQGLLPDLYVDGPETLDEIFNRVFADLDVETRAKLKQKYVQKSDIAEAPERIKKICNEIVHHYKTTIEPDGFKAMIVASTREAAVFYKKHLDKIGAPESMIIMTSELGEIGKDGLSWEEFYKTQEDRERKAEEFKDPNNSTKIIIVVDMLLTGFDCPVLKVMYLDKSIKEHTLLQAICRVNRSYNEQKKSGLIVDFIGVTKDLKKALQLFDDIDLRGALDTTENDLKMAQDRHGVLLDHISSLKEKDNSDILLEFEDPAKQETFAYDYKMFAKAVDELLPRKEAKQFQEDLKFGGKILAMIRTCYYGDKARIKEYGAKVQQIIDDHIKTLGISELLEPREITYANFGAFIKKYNKQAQAALLKKKVTTVILENSGRNPGFYEKISKRLEELIQSEKERRLENAAAVEMYQKLLDDAVTGPEKRMKEVGISDEYEFGVFEELTLHCYDEKLCKDCSNIISEKAHAEVNTNSHWKDDPVSISIMQLAIKDTLSEYPNEFSEKLIEELTEKIYDMTRRLL